MVIVVFFFHITPELSNLSQCKIKQEQVRSFNNNTVASQQFIDRILVASEMSFLLKIGAERAKVKNVNT